MSFSTRALYFGKMFIRVIVVGLSTVTNPPFSTIFRKTWISSPKIVVFPKPTFSPLYSPGLWLAVMHNPPAA